MGKQSNLECEFRTKLKEWGITSPTARMVGKVTRAGKKIEERGIHGDDDGERTWKWPVSHLARVVPEAVKKHGAGIEAIRAVEGAFSGSRGRDIDWILGRL